MKKVHSSVNLKLKRYKESVYYGEFVNGKRHGEGVMVYGQNLALMGKEVEEGQLLENNEDMLKYRTYEGQWENDFKHGKGIEKFSNGTVYEGTLSFKLRQLCEWQARGHWQVFVAQWVIL